MEINESKYMKCRYGVVEILREIAENSANGGWLKRGRGKGDRDFVSDCRRCVGETRR